MSRPYEWKPIPHRVDVTCPSCSHCAEFEFAEVVRIKLKSDVEFFQKSSAFEYREFQDSCGHYWHGALYFQGLHGNPHQAIHELPEGYTHGDWEHSRYLSNRSSWPVGSIRCGNCHARAKHVLNWPSDAYFSIAHRGHVLWAFHRESANELIQYLLSADRNLARYRWSSFLLHVPSVFKVRKAREGVVRQLTKLVGNENAGRNKR